MSACGLGNQDKEFRAGAARVCITPLRFPVPVAGAMLPRLANGAASDIHARCIALESGTTRLAMVVVDSCMLERELLDRAKARAEAACGLAARSILICATHCHAAPAAAPTLGTEPDQAYAEWLVERLAEVVAEAVARLEPAWAGWAAGEAWEHTHCRRWITRPDRMLDDPFGNVSVRAMMHPGHENPDYIGPAGPVDPGLTVLSLQHLDGRPLAVLANYSMHYFGSQPVSSDYYGLFAEGLARRLGASDDFVAMMSQGTSGDQQWIDYSRPRRWERTAQEYAAEMAEAVQELCAGIEYTRDVPLAMAESLLTLRRRTPDRKRLAWARRVLAGLGGAAPANREAVFAREQLFLHAEPTRELRLQAIRIGGLGISATPSEAFGLSGLKIKAQSPLRPTMNITLANGAEGYAPPREQHALGGYVTWPARTAGLEVGAERKITSGLLRLLEEVSSRGRRRARPTNGPYARAVLAMSPHAYWRLEETGGSTAHDTSGNGRHARYRGNVAFHLPGAQLRPCGVNDRPDRPSAFSGPNVNRAPQLAGGSIAAALPGLAPERSVCLWFWSGLAPQSGWEAMRLLTLSDAAGRAAIRLDLTGEGRLQLCADRLGSAQGGALIAPRKWRCVALVADRSGVSLYLDGESVPEVRLGGAGVQDLGGLLELGGPAGPDVWGFEGRLDEVAVFERALSCSEIHALYEASRPAGRA